MYNLCLVFMMDDFFFNSESNKFINVVLSLLFLIKIGVARSKVIFCNLLGMEIFWSVFMVVVLMFV